MNPDTSQRQKAVAEYATPEQRERLHRVMAEMRRAFQIDYLQEHWGISREAAMKMAKGMTHD